MLDPTPGVRNSSADDRLPIAVLLVDDQPFTGSVVGMLLAGESDIVLHCCLSAVDAIARANEVAPTVILQDLVMPDIDGLTLLRLFRANPQTAKTPVVVLSGNDDPGTRARALDAGADAYLVKIPPKAELIECIRDHAARRAGSREALDMTVFDRFRDAGAPEFLRRLIDQFLQEAHANILTLTEAAGRADAAAMNTVAHSLKGSARMMGALKLGALCAEVESQAALALPGTVPPALLAEIGEEFVRVECALADQRERTVVL